MNQQDRENQAYLKRRKWVSAVSIVILAALIAVLSVVVGKPLVKMVSDPQEFRLWVESHGLGGKAAFVGMMALQVIIALIPGEPLEIAAGYAFGSWLGLLLCIIGAAIGSLIVFGFVRLCGVRLVEAFISREKLNSVKWLHDSKKRNTLIFVLFFLPGTPKDVLTYFVGLTDMKWYTFLAITTVARIPSVITSAFSGNALGTQNYGKAIIIFGVTALLSLVGLLIYKRINGAHAQKKAEKQGEAEEKKEEEKDGKG